MNYIFLCRLLVCNAHCSPVVLVRVKQIGPCNSSLSTYLYCRSESEENNRATGESSHDPLLLHEEKVSDVGSACFPLTQENWLHNGGEVGWLGVTEEPPHTHAVHLGEMERE